MSAPEKPVSKFFWIVVAGIVSLVVGISSALLLRHFTNDRPELTYDITSLELFPGQTQKLGIVAIRIENTGRKEIEQLQCRIDIIDAVLKEPRCKGLNAASPKITHDTGHVEVSVPYLNPKEEFSLQLLVEPAKDQLSVPDIDIRGKGIVAVRKINDPKRSSGLTEILLPILATITAALGTVFTGIWRYLNSGDGLGVEQRDGFAFLLGLHGFAEQAAELRSSPRDYSWWTLADALTERLLQSHSKDEDAIQRGTALLQNLINQHLMMAKPSKAIIYLNLARLAEFIGDRRAAVQFIKSAQELDRTTADLRIGIVPSLANLNNSKEKAG